MKTHQNRNQVSMCRQMKDKLLFTDH